MHYTLAVLQRRSKTRAQRRFVLRFDTEVGDRQLDAVFLEARQPRPW